MSVAMILAAGSGQRLGKLGLTTPKALLEVAGKPLIVYHLERLAVAGISKVVINLAHLGDQIRQLLGNGARYGVEIIYSPEEPGGYETGGGIFHALPLLGNDPFIVMNADIWTDFPLNLLPTAIQGLAHIVLVDNPPHNSQGDFSLLDSGIVTDEKQLTFSGIGVYKPQLFANCQEGRFRLGPILHSKLNTGEISGQYYQGRWFDIGTPERLAYVQERVTQLDHE